MGWNPGDAQLMQEERERRKAVPKINEARPRATCEDCIYWETFFRHPQSGTGECRRRVPTGNHEKFGERMDYRAYWPVTLRNEWCGEGATKPTKNGGAS